jgi:hypothetical protein
MNEVKEEKKKSNAGLIAIIMVLCLCLGIAVGFIISRELGKDDKKEPDTKIEEKENKPEEKKEEEKKEEKPEDKNPEETPTPKNKTAVKAFGDECSFMKDCEKEFEITNGEKTYKIKVKKEVYTTIIMVDGKELLNYHLINEEHAIENIALLDNNYLVVETSIYAGPNKKWFVRDYFDSKLNKIAWMQQQSNVIEGELTSKEIIWADHICSEPYVTEADGSITVKKYKLVLNDNDKYEKTVIGTAKEGPYGNC